MMIYRLSYTPLQFSKAHKPRAFLPLKTDGDVTKFYKFRGHTRVEYQVNHLWQGYTNGCGTTSLAMALNCLTKTSGYNSRIYTQQQLDQKRPFDTYCAPGTLVKLAKASGYYAQQYNQSNFQVIKSHLNKGHLIIALHNAIGESGKKGPLHYVLVHGYQDGSEASSQKLFITDPGRQTGNKAQLELTYQDFCRYWERPKLGCVPIGVNRFMIAVSAKDDFINKGHQRLPITIRLANLFHNFVNWYAASWIKPIGSRIYKFLTLPLKALK